MEELQLSLSLSSSSSSSSSSCCSQIDLNSYSEENVEAKDTSLEYYRMKMEDLKKRKLCVNGHHDINGDDVADVDVDDDDGVHVHVTLPLLFCNKTNQEHDVDADVDVDDDVVNEVESTFVFINHKNAAEESRVVGWPPVKSTRKKVCHRKNYTVDGSSDVGWSNSKSKSKSMFVKVQMEGDGIARKINLNLHHSYHTLVHTSAQMFGKCNEDVKLTYQDKEGDWLLAGDVPWGLFTDTAQRLKLLKTNY